MPCQSIFALLLLNAVLDVAHALLLRGGASRKDEHDPYIEYCGTLAMARNLPPAKAVAKLGQEVAPDADVPHWLQQAHLHLLGNLINSDAEEFAEEEEIGGTELEFDTPEVSPADNISFISEFIPRGMSLRQYQITRALDQPVWVFSSYHKTGTVLIVKLINTFNDHNSAKLRKVDTAFCKGESQLFSTATWSNAYSYPDIPVIRVLPNYRLVHFIRDPVKLIVSAYRYHVEGTERWLYDLGIAEVNDALADTTFPVIRDMAAGYHLTPDHRLALGHFHKAAERGLSVLDYYRAAPEEEAVVVEAFRSWPEIDLLVRNYNATRHDPNTLQMRMETIQSKFMPTMRCMFQFLSESRDLDVQEAMRLVEAVDVNAHPENLKHVTTGKFDNQKVTEVLEAIPAVRAARHVLQLPAQREC
mmetsp:Transcript_22785/g.53179  ORF Transcript_22785/g.53179 Transcript_22785/m.53179 type:complete len:416 (+) Transcript_22785:115-1362(+)